MTTAARSARRPTVALLIFTRNDLPAAWEVVRRIAGPVDEVVVVDSSDPAQFEVGRRGAPPEPPVRVVRCLPTGYIDIVIPFGVAHVRSDWTLRLDTDEEVTPDLWERLLRLDDVGGYLVPRWEAQLGSSTTHLRLFRTRSYAPATPAYDHARIRGPVRELPRSERIVHHADFRAYEGRGEKAGRNVGPESYERPFTRAYAKAVLFGSSGAPSSRGGEPLGPISSRLVLAVDALRTWLSTGTWRSARFVWRYGLARRAFVESLSPADQERRLTIAGEIRASGSMTTYLGFDDPGYLAKLTAEWDWSADGPVLLDRLLQYRHAHGRPVASLSDLGSRARTQFQPSA
ncbi:MAG TPA: glycosyltransferase [Thermoplasmata archaeon]|nr:glycosyltransferase [Thermoplasmata archaeon]